jgi:hypothetical protein
VGRHSSSEKWPFYRSVVGWFLPWVLIVAVVGTAVWVAVDAADRDGDVTPSPKTAASRSPSPSPSATASPSPGDKGGDGEGEGEDVELITENISVQVLNASSGPDAGDAMAQRLEDLGFRIAAVSTAATPYTETTVFWSHADTREVAVRLAAKFGWVALPKPDNLSADVSIHVVVGEDET